MFSDSDFFPTESAQFWEAEPLQLSPSSVMDGVSQPFQASKVASPNVSTRAPKRKRELVNHVKDTLKRTCLAKLKEQYLNVTKRKTTPSSSSGNQTQSIVDGLQAAVAQQLEATRKQLDKVRQKGGLAALPPRRKDTNHPSRRESAQSTTFNRSPSFDFGNRPQTVDGGIGLF